MSTTSDTSPLRNVVALALLAVAGACTSSGPVQEVATASGNVVIKTVDENQNPLPAARATWWYSDRPGTPYELQCAQEACSEWILDQKISGPITVSAQASRVKANDPDCWDWFEGETRLVANPGVQQAVAVVLSHSAAVCT